MKAALLSQEKSPHKGNKRPASFVMAEVAALSKTEEIVMQHPPIVRGFLLYK